MVQTALAMQDGDTANMARNRLRSLKGNDSAAWEEKGKWLRNIRKDEAWSFQTSTLRGGVESLRQPQCSFVIVEIQGRSVTYVV